MAPAELAPNLPDEIDPPASAPPLAGNPIPAAVVCLSSDDALLLLATDGNWRSVPLPVEGEYGGILTADGTRLTVQTANGVDIWDLPAGTSTSVAFPDGYSASPFKRDFESWLWIDDDTLMFDDYDPGSWLIDVATGDATRVPYPIDPQRSTVDSEGSVIEGAFYTKPRTFIDWAGGQARNVDVGSLKKFVSVRATADVVAGSNGSAIVVASRSDLTLLHALPLDDLQGNYTDGKLGVAALLEDGTVLLQVPANHLGGSWWIVAWDPDSGDLSRVSRGSGAVPASYATAALD